MEAIIEQVTNLTPESRKKLMITLRDLAYSLEEPDDTFHRLAYLQLHAPTLRIAFELGLFKSLAASEKPLSVTTLRQGTGADPKFLGRLLRYLGSVGTIKETARDEYAANKVTKNLATRMVEAGTCHCFETIGPQYQALPAFMKQRNYQTPTDPLDTVFQQAWNTDMHQFAWFSKHPEKLRFFNDFMAWRREPNETWLTVYPVEEEAKDCNASRPVFVNMGGGIGHQCAQFKEKYPHLLGRIILQDLEHSIQNALPTPGVENMVHNFFEPQPVLDAKFYFLRGVLHNHPDDRVRLVLQHILDAMGPSSTLLLDELVLPETGVSDYGAALDLTMMTAYAASERTESQWCDLFDSVGLTLARKFVYRPLTYETVMEVRRKVADNGV